MRATSGITEKQQNNNLWVHIGVLLIVAAWGISFVSTSVLINYVTPTEAYIYRFIVAYLVTLIFCHKKFKSNSWKDELWFVVLGVCGSSIYFLAENTALKYTLATNVSLITTTSPLLTTLLLGALYRSERPSKGMVFGSVIAFLGVGLVIFNSSFVLKLNPLGDLLALVSALSFAIYSVALRRLSALYTAMYITRKTFFYGIITALPFLLLEPDTHPLSVLLIPKVWLNILFLGAVCSMVAYLVWGLAIKKLGTITASNYLYFQPVWTLIFSAVILGDKITIIGVGGCVLILLGVWLSDFLGRKAIK